MTTPKRAERVLVVDDSKAMRRLVAVILRKLGITHEEAANGADALTLLRGGGSFDFVLVDINMPVMDGLAFVREVRGNDELAHLPVIMVSTEIDMERIAEALEAGASEYIMKPISLEVLVDKLKLLGLEVGGQNVPSSS